MINSEKTYYTLSEIAEDWSGKLLRENAKDKDVLEFGTRSALPIYYLHGRLSQSQCLEIFVAEFLFLPFGNFTQSCSLTIENLFVLKEDKQNFENQFLAPNKNIRETIKERDTRYQQKYFMMLKKEPKITQKKAASAIYQEEKAAKRNPPEQPYIEKILKKP